MTVSAVSRFTLYIVLITCAGVLFGCMPGGGGSTRPERKKMFALDSRTKVGECNFIDPDYEASELPFTTRYVTMTVNGAPATFLSVSLPDASYDSAATALALDFKPFALPLLSQWAHQESKGVVFDLRKNITATELRADYMVETPGMFSIPVIFLYDRYSVGRMADFISIIKSVPAMQCKAL